MNTGGIFRKIVEIEKRTPDDKHGTRHLECGHSMVMDKIALHPTKGRCLSCMNQARQLAKIGRHSEAAREGTESFIRSLRQK